MSNQISMPTLGTKENPILISEYSEILSLNKNFKIKFKCEVCSKEVSLLVETVLNYNGKLLCPHHHQEEILMKKYGVKNISQIESVKEKKKETTIKHFGVDNPAKSKEISEKIKQTNLERYGHVCNLDSEMGIKQKKETWLKKYGVECAMQSEVVKNNLKKVFEEKYGVNNPFQLKEVREKAQEARFKKYGASMGFQAQYFYDNLRFDSSWELYFFIYHKDMGNKIIKEPIKLEYEINNKIYHYWPDFSVNGKLFEIKSSYWIKQQSEGDGIGKFNLIKSLNIEMISDNEILPYKDYVESKYGKNYIKQFKIIYNQSQ